MRGKKTMWSLKKMSKEEKAIIGNMLLNLTSNPTVCASELKRREFLIKKYNSV